jgi:hypothetical protein
MWNFFRSPRVPKSGTQLYDYRLGRRFDPGAPAEAFEMPFENPVILFRGSGRVAGAMLPLQPPQLMVNPNAGIAGIGGIQAGQFVGQPLIDPSQLEPDTGA